MDTNLVHTVVIHATSGKAGDTSDFNFVVGADGKTETVRGLEETNAANSASTEVGDLNDNTVSVLVVVKDDVVSDKQEEAIFDLFDFLQGPGGLHRNLQVVTASSSVQRIRKHGAADYVAARILEVVKRGDQNSGSTPRRTPDSQVIPANGTPKDTSDAVTIEAQPDAPRDVNDGKG